jgi:nicotinamidase-related amidase
MSDTALLVLDMMNRFDFEGGDRLVKAARAIVPRIETLRARFDAAGAPTIYVNDNFSHWQGQFGDLVAACRDAGGASASIMQRLAPRPHDYHVLKPKHSGFLATPLAILLAKLGARRLVLTGLSAVPAYWPPRRAPTCASTRSGCHRMPWPRSHPRDAATPCR